MLYTSGGLTTVCFILSSPPLQLKFSYLSIIVKLTCVANKSYYTISTFSHKSTHNLRRKNPSPSRIGILHIFLLKYIHILINKSSFQCMTLALIRKVHLFQRSRIRAGLETFRKPKSKKS